MKIASLMKSFSQVSSDKPQRLASRLVAFGRDMSFMACGGFLTVNRLVPIPVTQVTATRAAVRRRRNLATSLN